MKFNVGIGLVLVMFLAMAGQSRGDEHSAQCQYYAAIGKSMAQVLLPLSASDQEELLNDEDKFAAELGEALGENASEDILDSWADISEEDQNFLYMDASGIAFMLMESKASLSADEIGDTMQKRCNKHGVGTLVQAGKKMLEAASE